MRKITEINPARLRRLNDGFTTEVDSDGWTVVTANTTGREVFSASDKKWADYVIETITGRPTAA